MKNKEMLRRIMKRAWAIRREDASYIWSLCLKMAWAEAKKGVGMTLEKALEIRELVERYSIRLERVGGKPTGKIRIEDLDFMKNRPDSPSIGLLAYLVCFDFMRFSWILAGLLVTN